MEVDRELLGNQDIFLSRAISGQTLLEEDKKLTSAIRTKQSELEKAKQELCHSEKDQTYREFLMRERETCLTNLASRKEKKEDTVDIVEETLEKKIEALEKKKEDYCAKIDAQIEELKQKVSNTLKRVKKDIVSVLKTEENSLEYYNAKLRALDEKESTPKIRALEFDLKILRERLFANEKNMSKDGSSVSERLYLESIGQRPPQSQKKPQTPPSDPVSPLRQDSSLDEPPRSDYRAPKQQMPVFDLPCATEIVKEIGFSLADQEAEETLQRARTSDGKFRFPKIIQSSKQPKKVILKK